jgi:hypothetical protein
VIEEDGEAQVIACEEAIFDEQRAQGDAAYGADQGMDAER